MEPIIISNGIVEYYQGLLDKQNEKIRRVPDKKYNSKFSRFVYKKNLPIFLGQNKYHERDLENISQTCKVKGIDKKDLSVVVFDEHTDMYIFNEEDLTKIKKATGNDVRNKIHLGNWVLELIKQRYPDISLVGVRDFTSSGSRSLYSKYNDKVSFYLGLGFEQEKHFDSEDFEKTRLQNLNEFFSKKDFKPYTFISLDCDVSQDLLGKEDSNIRKCGDLKYDELIEAIKYIRKKSKIIGASIFGEGFMFGSFTDARENVNDLIRNFAEN